MATDGENRSGRWLVRCPGLTGAMVIGKAEWVYDSLVVEITEPEVLEWMRLDPESWISPAARLEYEKED